MPKSEEMLNQPIPDDNPEQLQGANAVENFLAGGESGGTQTGEVRTSEVPLGPSESGPADEAMPDMEEDSEESDLEKQIRLAQEELDRTLMSPQERYKSNLQDAGISMDEARRIIDCVVVQQKPWKETYLIGPSDTKVTFKTRMPKDEERLRHALEQRTPRYQATRDFDAARYNLAASLMRCGGKTFDHSKEDTVEQILDWILKIPNPLFSLLSRKLWKFDQKIEAVFAEGYIENF